MTATDTHQAIDAVFRIEQAKLIAGLARMVRDVGLAEELAQDALVTALEQWPKSGIPDKPGAWLMAAAKHRAIDRLRRKKLIERKHAGTWPRDRNRGQRAPSPTSMRRSTTTSATTCCVSSSPPAIRCSPPRRAWH